MLLLFVFAALKSSKVSEMPSESVIFRQPVSTMCPCPSFFEMEIWEPFYSVLSFVIKSSIKCFKLSSSESL